MQESNLAALRMLIQDKSGKDAGHDLAVLGEIFFARRAPWTVLENVNMTFTTETYALPCGCNIRLTIERSPEPLGDYVRLDPPLDIPGECLCYTYAEVLSDADLP